MHAKRVGGSPKRKRNAFTDTLRKAGNRCPRCGVQRGDSLQWFWTAMSEFYGEKDNEQFFKALPANIKQATIRSCQVTSLLGHLFDDLAMQHRAREHQCAGLLELGLYQSVELLNRALLHFVLGHPSTAFPLTRMALEVVARSAVEQLLHFYVVSGRRAPGQAKRFAPYLQATRKLIVGSSLESDIAHCSKNLMRFDWPDEAVSGDNQLDPVALGWTRTVRFLDELGVLLDPWLSSAALDELYGELSGVVHQRKTSIELLSQEHMAWRDSKGWAIRGVRPVIPSESDVKLVQDTGDCVMALVVACRIAAQLPFGDVCDRLSEWETTFKEWPHLMPRGSRAFVALGEEENRRARQAERRVRVGNSKTDEKPSQVVSAPELATASKA
jgi:hypothetical protein